MCVTHRGTGWSRIHVETQGIGGAAICLNAKMNRSFADLAFLAIRGDGSWDGRVPEGSAQKERAIRCPCSFCEIEPDVHTASPGRPSGTTG